MPLRRQGPIFKTVGIQQREAEIARAGDGPLPSQGHKLMARLKSRFLVDLLLRRTEAASGFATILAKGDENSGIILVQCSDRGQPGPLLERRFAPDGNYIWEAVGPTDPSDRESLANYQARRRQADPDLWIVELDIADAPRLVAEWAALT